MIKIDENRSRHSSCAMLSGLQLLPEFCNDVVLILIWKSVPQQTETVFVDKLSLWNGWDHIMWIPWLKILQVPSISCWNDGLMKSNIVVSNGSSWNHYVDCFSLELSLWRCCWNPVGQGLIVRASPVNYIRSRMLARMNKSYELSYLIRW